MQHVKQTQSGLIWHKDISITLIETLSNPHAPHREDGNRGIHHVFQAIW